MAFLDSSNYQDITLPNRTAIPLAGGQTYNPVTMANSMAMTNQYDLANQQANKEAMQRILSMRAVDPSVIQDALSEGGSLANRIGFGSVNDVTGLTPDQMMAVVNRVQPLNTVVNGTIDLADKIKGVSETKKLLADAENQRLATQNQRIGTAQQATLNQQNQDNQTVQRVAEANATGDNDWIAKQVQVDQNNRAFDLTLDADNIKFANELAKIGLDRQRLAQQDAQFKKSYDQRERELMTIRNGSGGAGSRGNSPYANPEEARKWADQALQYMDKDKEKVMPLKYNSYGAATAKALLANGQVTNDTIVPLDYPYIMHNDKNPEKPLVFNRFIFSDGSNKKAPQHGFYGVTDNNEIYYAIDTRSFIKGSGAGSAGSTPILKHAQQGN